MSLWPRGISTGNSTCQAVQPRVLGQGERRAAGGRLPADPTAAAASTAASPPPLRRPCPSPANPHSALPTVLPPNRSERKFSDDSICKYFLCGFCPYEEFRRTKNDCGDCPSVHDDACKAQWDALDDRAKERYGWAGWGWAGGGLGGSQLLPPLALPRSVCCHVPFGEAAA